MLGAFLKSLISRGSVAQRARTAFDAGAAELQKRNHAAAAEQFERALCLDPKNAQYHYLAGLACLKIDKREAACRHFRAALALDPAIPELHMALSQLEMPGPFYVDLLSTIHAHLRPRTYLEIGVETGQTLCLAQPGTRAIGVDPEPALKHSLRPGTVVHKMPSDEYFAGHDVQAEFDGMPIDLVFIDGMHHFEFALRDFINVEKRCSPDSTILIHDCYPLDRLTAERERHVVFWSGDIWRLMLALKKYRPDLRLHTIAVAPTGLGVARGLDPQSRVLEDKYAEIVREFLALDYSELDANKAAKLSLIPNDWEKIKVILQ